MTRASGSSQAPGTGPGQPASAFRGPRVLARGLLRQISADVAELAQTVQQFGQGHLDIALPPPQTPELAPLAQALEQMRADLAAGRAALQRSAADEVRRTWELEVARDIQQSFLPREFPEVPGAEIAAMMQAARDVGGDFYDVIPLSSDRVGVLVADVAGKGFPASLYMALARTLLRTHSLTGRARYLSDALESAQLRQLMRSGSSGALAALGAVRQTNEYFQANHAADATFFTLFYAVYEPASRRLVYVNAGHNPALLFSPASGAVAWLKPTDIAVGFGPDRPYEPSECCMQPADVLVLYTDGVTEAFDGRRRMFGEERLQAVVVAQAAEPAGSIVKAIAAAVSAHAGATPQSDDITLLVLRLKNQDASSVSAIDRHD